MTLDQAPRPLWVRSGAANLARNAALVVAGSLILALAAQVIVPMTPVPMTMQSFAVLVIAAVCGARLSAAIVLVYLIAGAAGLPVFAGGVGGWARLVGPTGGYLIGFLPCAVFVGAVFDRGLAANSRWSLVTLLLGHVIILFTGFVGLATFNGIEAAWTKGILPFVAGGVVKSLLAFMLLTVGTPAVRRFRARANWGQPPLGGRGD